MTKTILATGLAVAVAAGTHAQNMPAADSMTAVDSTGMSGRNHDLQEIKVTSQAPTRRMTGPVNGVSIGRQELFKAACCNLGESFTTNPSVDVSYSDAATGAKQIKLLGLSGTYVQMLTENMPDYRGVAAPYALGYVPGPWMKSISVSKGSASVKNGYESVTGQINIDYLKPEDEDGIEVNLFGNTKSRIEANITGNIHLDRRLSTILLTHYENSFDNHDGNGDGFYDQPKVRQYNVSNRWQWAGDSYIFHGGFGILKEKREGGQMEHAARTTADSPESHAAQHPTLYNIDLNTDRYEAYMKHAFILNREHGTNIALLTSASMHELNAVYGIKHLSVNQKHAYASLMFETDFTKTHNLSAGLSLNHDYIEQRYSEGSGPGAALYPSLLGRNPSSDEKETVPGAYIQYTLNIGRRLTAMAGLRADHSSVYGTFVTPRFHVKYTPADIVSLRISAGKGYRTVHALAENNYLLAGGRTLIIDNLRQEEAWNYGVSTALNIPIGGKTLKVNAEYYYTRFCEQAVADYDTDPGAIHITNLDGKSYSHTMQVDATYPLSEGLTLTAAYRLNDVKTTYGGKLMTKPLTNRYKGLLTASYKTPLGLWHFDATLQLNGGGRMPTPYVTDDGGLSWTTDFPAFGQLSAQITRWFRHWSVYIGGENLTAFRQKDPIIGASDPWSKSFDPTMVWGPVHGAVIYAGARISIGKSY